MTLRSHVSQARLRIEARVFALDEVELIGANIEHLARIGVNVITVCDYGSTDGTSEVISKYEAMGRIRVSPPPPELSLDELLDFHTTEVRRSNADWVMLLDADEFLLPRTGLIADCEELARFDMLKVPRYNLICTGQGPVVCEAISPERYHQLFMVVRPIDDFWARRDQYGDVSWIFSRVAPKLMARPSSILRLRNGGHGADPAMPSTVRQGKPQDLLIAHLPFTTLSRFRRKIHNVKKPTGNETVGSWHWHEWHSLRSDEEIRTEFEKSYLDAKCLALLRHSGMIASAADMFSPGMGQQLVSA